MNVTNNGRDSLPLPLKSGGYGEVGPGETVDLDIDMDHPVVKGAVHVQRIFVYDNSQEGASGDQPAAAQPAPAPGTAQSPMNEVEEVKPTSKSKASEFKSL